MKHTPGPWLLTDEEDSNFVYALNEAGYNRMFLAVQPGDIKKQGSKIGIRTPQKELSANARLISSAPELLEALKAVEALCKESFTDEFSHTGGHYTNPICPLCGGGCQCDDDCPRHLIVAAILKAKGEE